MHVFYTPDIQKNNELPEEEAYEEEMTQAEFNKMMDNYLAERSKKACSNWAKSEVEKAKELGITDGTQPQSFATREQVTAMIVRALK